MDNNTSGLNIAVFEEYKAAQAKVAAFFILLVDTINNLPDNQKIQRIGNGAYSIKFSDLSLRSWSPSYYDFKWQYKLIGGTVLAANMNARITRLQNILDDGHIIICHNQYSKERVLIHPDVVSNVRSILTNIGIQ